MNEVAKDVARGVNSESVGDPARFVALADLQRGLQALAPAPADAGRVALVVRRLERGVREYPDRVRLSADLGVTGDLWKHRGRVDPQMQIAVMQADVARLIANGQPLALFGDQLFVELDLSKRNLPAGTHLRIGDATLQVTPEPHDGCKKFQARFGADALRFVATKDLRDRNLRGIYMQVVEPGDVRPGDTVEVLARARA
jgi:hypothetical protein